MCGFAAEGAASDDAHLAAAVGFQQSSVGCDVYLRVAPYLRGFAVATAVAAQCAHEWVAAQLLVVGTGSTFSGKHLVGYDVGSDVYLHAAIDVSALIAAAVDVRTVELASAVGLPCVVEGVVAAVVAERVGFEPYISGVDYQFVGGRHGNGAGDASAVGCVMLACRHVGIVASANELVVDDELVGETDVYRACCRHAAHVAAAEERADAGGVGLVALVVRSGLVVGIELHRRIVLHIYGTHVSVKGIAVGQVYRRNAPVGIALQRGGAYEVCAVAAKEHLVGYDVGTNYQTGVLVFAAACRRWAQRGTVAAAEHCSADERWRSFRRALQVDGGSRHVGADGVKRLDTVLAGRIVEGFPCLVVLQGFLVGVDVGTVAASIYIIYNIAAYVDVGLLLHGARYVVAPIDVAHLTAAHRHFRLMDVGSARAAKHVPKDVAVEYLHVGRLLEITLVAAAVDVAADGDDGSLAACRCCRQHQQQCRGYSRQEVSFPYLVWFECYHLQSLCFCCYITSKLTVGLLRSGSESIYR